MSVPSEPFHIRPFQPEDETSVVSVWRACNLVVPQNDPHRDIEAKLAIQPELFLVCQLHDQIIATVMAGYEGHRGWINYLAVSPEHQGRGFGRLLMERAEQDLRALGCPKINLQVRATNQRVIRFYQQLGFLVDDVISLGKRL